MKCICVECEHEYDGLMAICYCGSTDFKVTAEDVGLGTKYYTDQHGDRYIDYDEE